MCLNIRRMLKWSVAGGKLWWKLYFRRITHTHTTKNLQIFAFTIINDQLFQPILKQICLSHTHSSFLVVSYCCSQLYFIVNYISLCIEVIMKQQSSSRGHLWVFDMYTTKLINRSFDHLLLNFFLQRFFLNLLTYSLFIICTLPHVSSPYMLSVAPLFLAHPLTSLLYHFWVLLVPRGDVRGVYWQRKYCKITRVTVQSAVEWLSLAPCFDYNDAMSLYTEHYYTQCNLL